MFIMGKVLLGRYVPGDSIVHQMDPRAKLILSFFFIIIIFLANNWQSYVLLLTLTIGSIMAAKVNFAFFIKGVRPLIWLILFTVLLQIFFSSGGTIFWRWGPFNLSYFGLINGAYVFCRFVLIIFMSTLLTLTTAPLEIADALEKLMMPLKKIKVPVYEISLMLSIALRFVPTLMDETAKIMNAQRSRGVNFGEGNIMQQIKSVVPLLVPLFVSSFNRAEDLATAMEARGYRGGEGRTKYRVHYWHTSDTTGCAVFVIVMLILLFVRHW